jgi:hypothetical protein
VCVCVCVCVRERERHHVSHPYKTTGKIIFLYTLIFKFLQWRREGKGIHLKMYSWCELHKVTTFSVVRVTFNDAWSFYITETLLLREKLRHTCRYFSIYTDFGGRYSSVGIALGYGLDDRSSRVRFPAEEGNFSLNHRVQNGSGAHPASSPMRTRGSFPEGKRLGR